MLVCDHWWSQVDTIFFIWSLLNNIFADIKKKLLRSHSWSRQRRLLGHEKGSKGEVGSAPLVSCNYHFALVSRINLVGHYFESRRKATGTLLSVKYWWEYILQKFVFTFFFSFLNPEKEHVVLLIMFLLHFKTTISSSFYSNVTSSTRLCAHEQKLRKKDSRTKSFLPNCMETKVHFLAT